MGSTSVNNASRGSLLVSLGVSRNLRWTRSTSRAVIFLLLSYCCCIASADSISIDQPPLPTETLLIDTRIPVFLDGQWHIMSADEHRDLRIRREAEEQRAKESESSSDTTASETSKDKTMVATTAKHTSITATTATTAIDISTITGTPTTTTTTSPLPSPFDGALGANFTDGDDCPEFINEFLSNSTFKDCYPVSLLLQGSQSFFQAEKTLVGITEVLDAACQANVTSCTSYFNDLADQLISDSNCGKDFKLQNAIVTEAYAGMRTYQTIYEATCLMGGANQDTTDTSSSSSTSDKTNSSSSGNGTSSSDDPTTYCFASAVTDDTTSSNTYLYFLPYNSSLPDTSAPSCGSCTKQTMEIYQAATSDRNSDIADQYVAAAQHINSVCGSDFVNTTLATAVDSGAMTSMAPPSTLLLATVLAMAISRWVL
ncbi:hypothetical protein F5Y16DRAFT_154184 [Xylariaceae sp. FL0255]|nr:hypothetical protein F5Y16DRAFT_154184 [Xylariaceae sp. FL0255]